MASYSGDNRSTEEVPILIIQNFSQNAPTPQIGRTTGPVNSGAAPVNSAGPASARVTNFAQNVAMDGSAMMNIGANSQGLFPGGGYDIDRSANHLIQKIAAGRTTGDDAFAAAIASVGEDS